MNMDVQGKLFNLSESTPPQASPPAGRLSIVGASASGKAAARLAQTIGVKSILISDNNPNAQIEDAALRHAVTLERGEQVQLLEHAETVVLSPGIPPHSSLVNALLKRGFTLLSEPDWAAMNQPSHVAPWVSVTGTNGKSTITSLISHVLNHLGLPLEAKACGNIGNAVADVITHAIQHPAQPRIQPVVELSSYQLYYSNHLKHRVGVFSNLTPDHLEWHGGLKGYEAAKAKLFVGEQAATWAVLNVDDPVGLHWASQRQPDYNVCVHTRHHALPQLHMPQLFINEKHVVQLHIPEGMPQLAPLNRLNILNLKRSMYPNEGAHHTQNLLLSLGAVLATALEEQCLDAVLSATRLTTAYETFSGLEHRFERLKADRLPPGCIVINDSKATNPESCIVALESFRPETPVLLLVGGLAKKTPLDAWANTVQQHAKAVYAYGRDAHDFIQALEQAGYTGQLHRDIMLEDALARALAEQGKDLTTPLLFSPACASFDGFANFEARGQAFKHMVYSHYNTMATVAE
jgi:UDP-N-acetylmuramoylalanine--D-glutamate ligase